ncbi:MAG TPA: GGDEF domain-containing protein, partial [Ilumatobacteraceae bacterium]|nr:GGDEF domain-containing protein [Ilumatobacteraceae bacterium]
MTLDSSGGTRRNASTAPVHLDIAGQTPPHAHPHDAPPVPHDHLDNESLARTAPMLLKSHLASAFGIGFMVAATASSVDTARLIAWIAAAVTAEVLSIVAMASFRNNLAAGVPIRSLAYVRAATFAVGLLWGTSLLMPTRGDTTSMLTHLVFAYGASAFGLLLTSARSDLHLCFQVPLIGVATYALLTSGDGRLMVIGAFGSLYFAASVMVHNAANRSSIGVIETAWRTNYLVENLAAEHDLLVTANTAAAELNRLLTHQATHDPLTGLFNRRGAIDALGTALAAASPSAPVGLLYLDLDRFKHINDTLGHRGGDQFIAVVADRLGRSLDPGATAGRIGGDEFIVVLPRCDIGASMAVATRISSVLGQPVHAEGREVPSSVSVGIAVAPEHGTNSSDLLRFANAALHRAKGAGRNRVDVF